MMRNRKIGFLAVIMIGVVSWFAWDAYQSKNWIAHTYPADGATKVPRDVKITADWKGSRVNMLGIPVRYANEPDKYIPGATTANQQGISFKPEQELAPGREVVVTVEAGRRHHTFTFTTAEN
ncbi:Ig-like domain-containing protein [Paenibacillus swuensis]|uniref:Ig-like domain-containing protein n=1 Tax=Paenibacillus swuensis TaxID=1178515 RepID=UPI0008395C7B|nr:Ig-like domain-containing protein [Paenibacillus swuensis]